ncbi:MAG: hypothetical protein AB7U73_07965 [Pirellulales bacterium]
MSVDNSSANAQDQGVANNEVKRARLHIALTGALLAYMSYLARHPRTLLAGLVVATAQFFFLMLLDGRLTISEPTPAANAATQNQVADGQWLPPALAPEAAEAPKWSAATALPDEVTPADEVAPAATTGDATSEAPAFEVPAAQLQDAEPWNGSNAAPEVEPSAQTSAPPTRLTTEQAAALMARRPEPIAAVPATPQTVPGVARLRGQIVPQDLRRQPPISPGPGMPQ